MEVELVVAASLARSDKLPAPVATRQRIVELEGRVRALRCLLRRIRDVPAIDLIQTVVPAGT